MNRSRKWLVVLALLSLLVALAPPPACGCYARYGCWPYAAACGSCGYGYGYSAYRPYYGAYGCAGYGYRAYGGYYGLSPYW